MKYSVIALALLASASEAAVPKVLSFTGTLSDAAGVAVPDGSRNATFRLFQAASGGTALWQNTYSVQTASGVFTALLGTSSVVLEPALFANDQIWLEIELEGDVLAPRMRLVSVPYAISAASLECDGCVDASEIDPSQVQSRVTGSCTGGQAVGAVNEDGTVLCVNAGGALAAGPGIDITSGMISTSFSGFLCTAPDKVCGFDAAGAPICCADQGGTASLGFDCPGTDKVKGWDLAGNPQCETDAGGGGGVTQVNTEEGLSGGPIIDTGTVRIANGGVTTQKIAAGAVSQTLGTADLASACMGGTLGANDSCQIGTGTVVLFERVVLDPGICLFQVHLNTVTHDLAGGDALGLQLNNATADQPADPQDAFDTWDYSFTVATPTLSISRTLVYEKSVAGLETLQVRAWTNGGTATINPYSTLGGHNAGLHVIHLKR